MSYEPQGKVRPFVEAVRREPTRIWSPEEVASMLDVPQGNVGAWLTYPMKAGAVHRGKQHGKVVYSGQPFPPEAAYPPPAERNKAASEELNVPKFTATTGWKPPQMTAPRPGSEHPRVLASSPRPAPLSAPAPRPAGLCQGCSDAGCAEKGCQDEGAVGAAEKAPVEPAPPAEPVPIAPAAPLEPVAAPPADNGAAEDVDTEPETEPEEEAEAMEPDAFISCRTGEVVLVGCPTDDEGRVTIPADLVMALRRQIAWMPAARIPNRNEEQ